MNQWKLGDTIKFRNVPVGKKFFPVLGVRTEPYVKLNANMGGFIGGKTAYGFHEDEMCTLVEDENELPLFKNIRAGELFADEHNCPHIKIQTMAKGYNARRAKDMIYMVFKDEDIAYPIIVSYVHYNEEQKTYVTQEV